MSHQKPLWQMVGVSFVMLLLAACGTPIATTGLEPQTSTPTSVPATATPRAVPTSTLVPPAPTRREKTGTAQGNLIGAESAQPLAGAAVVLCSVVAEQTCMLRADLVSISTEEGSFELTEVPPGSYVVFYNPSAEASSTWEELDGLEMILKLEGLGLSRFPSPARTELFSTFGGGGSITWQKGTSIGFDDAGVLEGDGSIISEEHGLTMDFHEGKPITVEVQPGETTAIEIRAWGL